MSFVTTDQKLVLDTWLTQRNLLKLLEYIFGNSEIVYNKRFSDTLFRPDYVIEDHKLIVEFDGYRHYTQSATIIQDTQKDALYKERGYNVLRLPYFVQLSPDMIAKAVSNPSQLNLDFEVNYPHGFVHPGCVLPADFCEIGLKRFLNDLETFSNAKRDILASLTVIEGSMPPSLQNLILSDIDRHQGDMLRDYTNALSLTSKKTTVLLTPLRPSLKESAYSLVHVGEDHLDQEYKAYTLVGGQATFKRYIKLRQKFLSVAQKPFTGCNSYYSREMAMKILTYHFGSLAETERIFVAIDSVLAFS